MEKLESPNNPRYVKGLRCTTTIRNDLLESDFLSESDSYIQSTIENDTKNSQEGQNNLRQTENEESNITNKKKNTLIEKESLISFNLNNPKYYLKLENKTNSCFANVILQAFLSLGYYFFEKVKFYFGK